jgi:hypothetical protein
VHYQGNCICINFNNVPYKDKEFSVFFFLVQTNMTSIAKKIKVQSHPPDTRSLVYVQVVTIGRG